MADFRPFLVTCHIPAYKYKRLLLRRVHGRFTIVFFLAHRLTYNVYSATTIAHVKLKLQILR